MKKNVYTAYLINDKTGTYEDVKETYNMSFKSFIKMIAGTVSYESKYLNKPVRATITINDRRAAWIDTKGNIHKTAC